jgi:hypothetical protein
VVEEIIGRLPKLTRAQLSRLEDELRHERQLNEGGKRRKLYLGKTSDPESTLGAKRAKPLGE